jgi:Domain of unknown function (DUF4440)
MTTRGAPEQEVWEREVACWEHLKAGDLTSFVSLLHDDVTAWPSRRSTPVDKDGIVQHMLAILPALQAHALIVELKPLSIRVIDEVAVVHYEAHTRYAMKLGGRVLRDETQRYSRTWLRTERGWQLIAGMSAAPALQSP